MRKLDRQRQKNIQTLVADVSQMHDKSTPVDSQEIGYMDKAVEAWVWWSYGVGPQQPISFSRLMKLKAEHQFGYLMKLTDEQFMLVDRAIAKLPKRMQAIIEIEYREGGTVDQKAQRLGVDRREFRGRVDSMLSTLYGELLPGIAYW